MSAEFRHGLGGYTNHRCRCDVCKAGNMEWQRGARERRAAALRQDPSIAVHGSASTYENYRCRCRPCADASAAARRTYRDTT